MKANLALLASILSLGACLDAQEQTPAESDNVPRLSSNALMPSKIAHVTYGGAALTGPAISAQAASQDGRDFLGYMIACALDNTQSITTTSGAFNYTFNGLHGFAPGWTSAGLSVSDQRWVTACILARSNLTGTVVQISMRGSNSVLSSTTTELNGYKIEEGAFYGNIFSNTVVEAGCNGIQQAADDTYSTLPLRQCAQPGSPNPGISPCGFQYMDLCSIACTSLTNYAGCADGNGTRYNEVITTFLYGQPR
jgi:hypothetical protein